MTGDQMREIRERLGLTQAQFGSLLGYSGNRNTMDVLIYRYESGKKPIPLYLARYIWILSMVLWRQPISLAPSGQPRWPKWLRHTEQD